MVIARSPIVEIYPREGTETAHDVRSGQILMVEIYPREGAETIAFSKYVISSLLKFIPVRGRKPFSCFTA